MKIKLKKYLYISLGTLSLILGTIGIVLPLLPTTPFLLVSAFFYLRSSRKLYNWLLNHKIFGIYIYSYIHYHSIDLKTKITSVSLLWTTLIISMIILNNQYLTLLLITIGLAVSTHLLMLKTLSKKEMVIKRNES
ncbi:MAG: YbaN family protein [Tenericutes bacterium]|jgi:uncharacterized membrane protein YbaN (DUF454 family)|nr:YbaN family protein [Mycoplasmatota bacterium]